MNNLQPLKWVEGLEYITAKSPLHTYTIFRDGGKLAVSYQPINGSVKEATGFRNYAECEEWAWNHYNEKMQPYVKPLSTWISVDDRLPERKDLLSDKDKCLVLTECGKVWTGFYNMHIKPDAWYLHGWTQKEGWHPFKIVAWMLASDLSDMQNLHNGSEVTK